MIDSSTIAPTPCHTPTVHASHDTSDPDSPRVLLVDDEEAVRVAVGKFLRAHGYEVHVADSAAAAVQCLERSRFALMICDVRMPGGSGLELIPDALACDPDLAVRMPGGSGLELIPDALACDPDLAVMMLSAVNDAPTATEAMSLGAVDYLVKPVELGDLQQSIERALAGRRQAIEQRLLDRHIRDEVRVRTAELEREKLALRTMTVSVAETLINAMEAKDVYLRGHSQRVADLGTSIASEMGLDEDTVENIRLAGRLHDVGKIGIREAVLNKPGRLTADEFEHVKDHVRIGMEILAPLRHIDQALRFVQDHHEHWDGNGYPRGLAGEAISIGGRVLVAADAFDAMTSKRAYRESMTPEQTLEYLGAHATGLLDPAVYAALRVVIRRRKTLVFIDDIHG